MSGATSTPAAEVASDRRKRRELLASARLGVREAQYALGLMCVNGEGGGQDLQEAVSWIRQAAEKGLPAAQYALGARHAAGLMGEKDDLTAHDWFARAADQGHARAMLRLAKLTQTAHRELATAQLAKAARLGMAEAQAELGKAYAAGQGVREDWAAAFDWTQKAALQGLPAAQYQLAELHESGRGTKPDPAEALRWYRKASAQDHPPAIVALNRLDARGMGRSVDQGGDGPGDERRPAGQRPAPAVERRRAARRWFDAVDPGDAESRYRLGQMFEGGIEAPLDRAKAKAWFLLAARQGDRRAQAALGRLLEESGDTPAALDFYQQAAAQGDSSAQVALGRLDSTRVDDPDKAFAGLLWYARAAGCGDPVALATLAHLLRQPQGRISQHCFAQAAEQGSAEAQYMLAQLHERGTGIDANPDLAAGWYRRAAEQGHAPAQCALAQCHLAGKGVLQSATEAHRWLLAAAEQGDARAQWNLGSLCASGGEGVAADMQKAFFWCLKAADQGFLAAQSTLGLLYARIDEPEQALRLLTAAAEAGDAEARYNLASMLASGQGCQPDAASAFRWFVLAAEQGVPQAQARIAILYADGAGVAADRIEAHKWFVIAARAGDAGARTNRATSEAQLDPAQVDEAVRRADAWKAARLAAAAAASLPG